MITSSMPDNRQVQNNAVSTTSNGSPDKLEEAMWGLKIQDNQEGEEAQSYPYPNRPGEPNCIYYLRTGLCGYGSNCRYNHPTYIGEGTYKDEFPERVGQPDCQYFMRTGTCKFGVTCKYHHPRDRHPPELVQLNIFGLPMRQDEKPCPYYMRTWSCKFGIACKFHHPQPATVGAVLPVTGPSAYGSTGLSVAPPTGLSVTGGSWSSSRPPIMPSPRMQGFPAYMPILLPPSQGVMPATAQQGWGTYMGTVNHVSSTDFHGNNQISNSKHHELSGPSTLVYFPERPDQPECQYYMKTGSCKYGTSCKYHHPKERNTPLAMCTLGPLGLPQRPDQAVCMFYSTYGSCKYGSACKFDHPSGYYNYPLPNLSISYPSALSPYQRNSQVIFTSSETSPSKTSKLPDRFVKPETSTGLQNSVNNVPDDPPPQTNSPSDTAPF